MKNGLIIEGGARRCIYSAGVVDCLAESSLSFDYVCGVSAGAQIAADLVAGQIGRSRNVMMPYGNMNENTTIKDVFSVDLKRLVYEFPYKQYPLDFKAIFKSPAELEMTATCCETAQPEYFSCKKDEKSLLDAMYASCCLPLLYTEIELNGKHYVDGSISDSLPFERAFDCGCERVLVILSKAPDEQPTDYSKLKYLLARKYKASYPNLYELFLHRAENYHKQRTLMNEYVKQGKIYVIEPDRQYVKPMEQSSEKLETAYAMAFEKTKSEIDFIKTFFEG